MANIAGEMKRSGASATSEHDPKITLDLKDVFGVPELPTDTFLRAAIGQSIVDKIVENTKSGDFLKESSGAQKYSKGYAESFEFKVYGKSQGDVNLTASGDMLRAIDFNISDDGIMTIFFDDPNEAAKAHGHITGNVGKKRDFFGLDHQDLVLATREFSSQVREKVKENKSKIEIDEDLVDVDDITFVMRLLSGED